MIWKMIGNIKSFLDKCKRDNINAFAAQTAFFIILSIIPFLMVFSALLQYTPVTEGTLLEMVNRIMPQYIAPFMVSIINEVYTRSVGLVSIAVIVAIWSAAKGVQYLVNGLNVVNEIVETRNWFILRFWAVIYTIVFVIAITVTLVLIVFGKSLQGLIVKNLPILAPVVNLIMGNRSPIMLVFLILFFTVAYTWLPNRRIRMRSQLPGAILCSVAWYVFSFGISVYVNYFNGFSMYGSLTTIVLIMLWLYFCIYIMMLCAEFNIVFNDRIEQLMNRRKYKKIRGGKRFTS
ncbi:MAG: YihY/virulence factor BrkB family protein [Lachnospiraceae bacterium]|nr:YihY/virulence factor BrkB family protein [Lachnospiraceae bacterium]